MNPAAEKLTGWALPDVYGKKFNDTFRVSSSGLLKTKEQAARCAWIIA